MYIWQEKFIFCSWVLKLFSAFHWFLFFFMFIEFLGVTLVKKLYRFQVYSSIIHHLYCVFTTPSHVSFHHHSPPFTHFYLPQSHSPLVITIQLSVSMRVVFFLNPITQSHNPSPLVAVSLFSTYESVSILFVSLFCSLDSTYEWNHMVFVFLWLAYFT